MSTMAIVGAGKGLGAAVARKFGAEGYSIALISRNQERVDELAAQLESEGLTVKGYTANVRDPQSLIAALDAATQDLGLIEVLQYSPLPQKEFLRPVLETTVDDLKGAIEFSVYGPVAAAHQVLQGMRTLGKGSILFINGGSAAKPVPAVAGTSIAFAGETAFAAMLHETLKDENIGVGQLIIPGAIEEGSDEKDVKVIAEKIWHLHTHHGEFRVYAQELPGAWEPTES